MDVGEVVASEGVDGWEGAEKGDDVLRDSVGGCGERELAVRQEGGGEENDCGIV